MRKLLGVLIGIAAAAVLFIPATAKASLERPSATTRTPVVMFPAYFFTTLKITVHQQTVAPECPSSGSFRVFFLNDEPSAFSLVCQQKLLTMRYQPKPAKPMPRRFRDQRGVDVRIENYGKTESAPFYEPMYEALEETGYVRDQDIRVAGYDSRLTPDMRNFLNRAKRLIEDTYRDNGNQPVTSSATRTDRSTSSTSSPTPRRGGRTSTSTASRRSRATSRGRESCTHSSSPAWTSATSRFRRRRRAP